MTLRILQQACELRRGLAHRVLHIALRLAGRTRKRKVNVYEILRKLLQRPEIRQFLLGARAEEEHELAAFKLTTGPQAAAPFSHGAHGRAAGAGANHHDMAAGMIGHQKAAAKWADDLHGVASFQIAQIIRRHALDRLALVVLYHALDRERQVVIAGPLSVAWAGNGILARMMRSPAGIHTRRNDAN